MRKYFSIFLSIFLVIPFFANAVIIEPSLAHITVIKNTISGDNVFGFNLTKYTGPNWNSYRWFEVQTVNSTASFQAVLDVAPDISYELIEYEPFSWGLESVVCESDNGQQVYNTIERGVRLSNIAKDSNITCVFTSTNLNLKDPVLIIPGIMGTEIYRDTGMETELLWPDVPRMFLTNNDRFMDPLAYIPEDMSLTTGPIVGKPARVFDYSEGLINEFISQGYIPGVNLFTFPYDWRKDLDEIAENEFRWLIDYDILGMYGFNSDINKIDIIAHSQGGLVFKRFVAKHPKYNHVFGKAVFAGTPHLGAPKAAKALLYGDNMNVSFGPLGLDPAEVKRISKDMPSVYELLPSEEYFDHSNGYLGEATIPNPDFPVYHVETLDYPESDQFLKDNGLNAGLVDAAVAFHADAYDNFDFTGSGIKAYNIIGCQEATINKIITTPNGGYGLFYGPGDSTVPVISAGNVGGTVNFYALDSDHGQMLTQDGTRQQIVNLIAGSSLSTVGKITPFPSECHFNGQQVAIHSPVDMHIYDEQGNHTGPLPDGSVEFGIPKVQYDIVRHDKFAFLPSGPGYTVKLEATDSGNFSFDSSQISGGEIGSTAYYNNIGVAPGSKAEIDLNSANNQNINLDLDGDGETDQIIPPTLISGDGEPQDLVPPVSTSTLTGLMGQPGYYRSDVSIVLSAIDPIIEGQESQTSGILKTLFSVNDGDFQEYNGTTTVASEGSHNLKFYSIDRAGNNEPEQVITFTIDKTPPEFKAGFSLDKNDFVFQATDGGTPILPQCTQTQCTATDTAGNTSKLIFQKNKLLTLRSLSLKKIERNGEGLAFPDNLFIINNINIRGQFKDFNQTVLIKKQEIGRIGYLKKRDISNIIELTKQGMKRYSLPGIHFLEIATNKNALAVNVR